MTGWLLALAFVSFPQEPPRAAEPELERALLADVRAWIADAEPPPPDDVHALCEEAERIGAGRELVRELGNLGHRLDQLGRGDEGRALVAWSGEHALAAGDLETRAWAFDWLGENAWVHGELDEAARLLTAAAETDARRRAPAERARHLADVARVRLTQGRLDEAELAIAGAEAAAREAGSSAALRETAEVRGSLLFELGRHREALELCRAHADDARRDVAEVRLEQLAADVLADVGRLDSAAAHARRALEVALAPEVARVAPLLHLEPRLTLAHLYGDLGRCDEALALLDQSAEEFARLGDARGAAWTDKNRGFALFAAGRLAEALPCFERAWRAGAELGVPFLEGIDALGVAETLAALDGDEARLSAALDGDEARLSEALDAAARVAAEHHERTLEWRVSALRGARLLAHGEYEPALLELRRAVVRIERWRAQLGTSGLVEHALRERSDPYRDAAFAAAHLARPAEALRYASLLQSRVLDELCERGDGPLPEPAPALAAAREKVARLEARLGGEDAGDTPSRAELERALARAEDELDAAQLAGELASGRVLGAHDGSVPVARLGEALAAQGFDAALVYVVGAQETLALRIGAGRDATVAGVLLPVGRRWIEERSERLLAPLARVASGALDLAHLGFDVRAARELADALVRPLALPSGARVALVADGALAALPFEMLVSGGEPGAFDLEHPFAHLAGLRFLADDASFVAFGSLARLLQPLAAAPRGPDAAVVFLAPAALGVPRAADEARAIEHALGTVRIGTVRFGTVRIVADARPEDVRALAPGARLVHFAVHGRLDETRPAHGQLVLGGADGAGARLESWQAAELALGGATVVLSSCDSGGGEWRAGAGLAGLTHGFLLAGAREVVASRWAVDDRATLRFMELFYGELARGRATAEALELARRALRNEQDPRGFALAHPLFWAAWFVQR